MSKLQSIPNLKQFLFMALTTTFATTTFAGATNANQWATTLPANPKVDLAYLTRLLTNVNNPAERERVLGDAELFKQFVDNEIASRAVIASAFSNQVAADKNIAFLMQRNAETVLREAYFRLLVADKLPADFPTAAQVAEYYQRHKDKFVLPERVHVWQIFLEEKQTEQQISPALKKRADQLYQQLIGGADFEKTAIAVSEHAPSRVLGGYMGLVKTTELLPDLRAAILALDIDEISKPIPSDSGMHLFKRGERIAEQPLSFTQAEAEAKRLLLIEANAQLRAAVLEQAKKEFPQNVSAQEIEAWRLRLNKQLAESTTP